MRHRVPRKFRIVVPLVALTVLVVAGAAIGFSIKDDVTRALPAVLVDHAPAPSAEPKKPATDSPAASNRPIGDDEPAFWSDVAILKAGPNRPRPILVVTRGQQPMAYQRPTAVTRIRPGPR